MTGVLMPNQITVQTVQRLAFVRFLYEQGVSRSAQPEPLSATAILSFQDAIEHFLLLGADHLGVNLPNDMKFLQFWERLKPKLPQGQELPGKQAMSRVNKLRVDFKHYGIPPATASIMQARADVATFFTDATPLVFGVDFDAVDMVDLVPRAETVKFLRYAQARVDAGDHPEAMAGLLIAFMELIDHYTEVGRYSHRPPFRIEERIHDYRDDSQRLAGQRRGDATMSRLIDMVKSTIKQVAGLTQATQEIQRVMQVIALGIDYTRYAQFQVLTPYVHRYSNGTASFVIDKGHKAVTANDYQFGRLFVIESALQAAKADAVLQRRNDHTALNGGRRGDGESRQWEGPNAREPLKEERTPANPLE
ncbi:MULTISPECIES: hypothetical protein [unclassified Streptomyces]|uniref:hypothetical protein n=1 Tax=unclassified Streptomyces TaxID=2593676 RepID=UPI00403D14A1